MTIVTSNRRSDLPPCPFCGGVPEMYYPFHLMGQQGHAANYHGGVKCTQCQCKTRTTTPPDEAIAAWKMRASDRDVAFAELTAEKHRLSKELERANSIVVRIGVIAMEATRSQS